MANSSKQKRKKNVEKTPEKPPPVKRTKTRSRIDAGGGRSSTSSSPPSVLEGLTVMERRAPLLEVDEDDENVEDINGEDNDNGEDDNPENREEDNNGKEDNDNGEDNNGEDNRDGDSDSHEDDITTGGHVAALSTAAAGSGMFDMLILVCLIVAILMLAFQALPFLLETEIESAGKMGNRSMLWIVCRGLLRIICSER